LEIAGVVLAIVPAGSSGEERSELFILDIDVVYFQPGLFRQLADKLVRLGVVHHFAAAFVPAHLEPLANTEGVLVEVLPEGFDPTLYILTASGIIGRGLVRFCQPVISKMPTETIAAALALKAGNPIETALQSALISSIALQHMDASMFESMRKKAPGLVH
jgi:hypothetical protein